MEEWLEYITVENATLVVGLAALVVAILSYRYNRNKDKKQLKSLIESKEAQLHNMEMGMKVGINAQEYDKLYPSISSLQAEIEQLKKQL